jgi:hypothetical protein
MARKRKTIEVSEVLAEANRLLALPDSKYTDEGFRRGVACMLEHFLHATGNYEGYNFLGWAVEGGCDRWRAAGEPKDNTPFIGDESRRVYYASPAPIAPKSGASVDFDFPKACGFSRE